MAATTEQLEARIAKLEEKLDGLALFIAMDVIGDEQAALVWEEELVDVGTPDEEMWGDWTLRGPHGVRLEITESLGGTEPIGEAVTK